MSRIPLILSPRVLIIDDDRDSAETMRTYLDLSGVPTAVAFSAPDGLAWAFANAPVAVVSDIGLPGMNGLELATALRSDARTVGCRLIAVTGYGTDGDRADAIAAGFDMHLTKPADPAEVLRAVS